MNTWNQLTASTLTTQKNNKYTSLDLKSCAHFFKITGAQGTVTAWSTCEVIVVHILWVGQAGQPDPFFLKTAAGWQSPQWHNLAVLDYSQISHVIKHRPEMLRLLLLSERVCFLRNFLRRGGAWNGFEVGKMVWESPHALSMPASASLPLQLSTSHKHTHTPSMSGQLPLSLGNGMS